MQRALRKLKDHALHVIKHEPEDQHLPLMRNKAGELDVDLDVKDKDLEAYLLSAEASQTPVQVYRKGQSLQASESVFLLEGMVKLGEANVIIGQPKVGKSSFSTGLIAAIRDRRETFLGRELLLPNEGMPVLIFGTDQSEGDWLHFLRRESLVNEEMTLSDSVDFFCSLESGQKYNFTKDGIRAMRDEINQHACPLVIIDSLSSMMEPTGIEENTSRFAQPIRTAISELRKTGATLLIIHHSVKRPNTWDWIQECRGSSSISSVMSWGVLMRYVSQEEEGLARTDVRVGFAGKGRGSAESGGVMGIYLADGGWTYLDGLERAQAVSRVMGKIEALGGVRVTVFDYLVARSALAADVSVDEVANELNKQRSAISRELRILKSKGLVDVAREEYTGATPRKFWRVSEAAEQAMNGDDDRESQKRAYNVSHVSLPMETMENNKNKDINSQKVPIQELEPAKETTAEQPWLSKETTAEQPWLSPRTPVARLISGEWQTGWLIRDGRNKDAITVEKLGNPNLTVSNLRWNMDVKAAGSAFSTPKPDPEPQPFEQPDWMDDLPF